jgi:hypothetical protein
MKPSLKIVVGWAIGSILGYATALLMTYYVQPDSLPTMAVFIPIMAAIVLIPSSCDARSSRPNQTEPHFLVIAGLVPAIPIGLARARQTKRPGLARP